MVTRGLKIGVLSDTHLGSLAAGAQLAERLLATVFAGVDGIIHAGDQVVPGLEACFSPLPWYGVRGNMDVSAYELPARRIILLGGKRIGLIHGWGAPDGIEDRVLGAFSGENLDVLVFGHSHRPLCRTERGVLLFNPGSPTDRRYAPWHSVGMLTIGQSVTGEIIRLDE